MVQAGQTQCQTANLSSGSPQATASTTTSGSPQATANATTNQAVTPATTRRAAKKQRFIPLAILSLIEPVIMASANAQSVLSSGSTEPLASNQNVPSKSSTSSVPSDQSVAARTPSSVVSNYYTDVEQIPQYAVDDVAAATKANLVVNGCDL